MAQGVSDCEYEALEPTLPLRRDPKFVRWAHQLMNLSSSEVSIRDANADAQDGRRMKDLQVLCAPISVRSVRDNASTIAEQLVLLAEIDDVHIGFCVAFAGLQDSEPIFIQVVAVAPAAQRRGAGLALLAATAELRPRRDIVLATQDDNAAALSLNEQFAKSIGTSIRRAKGGTYQNRDLGIPRGLGYHAWIIQRPPIEP